MASHACPNEGQILTRWGLIAAVAASICGIAAAKADEVSVKAALAKASLRSLYGVSSYYGPGFHGRPTADGEIFDVRGLTAAHKTLPIPSYARVTNLRNGRSVIVRINDRGPYAAGRMLDVSARVAHLLNYHGGLEKVRLDYLGMAGPDGAEDQSALLATLKTDDAPIAVAKAKPAADDGVTVATRSAPALAYADQKPRAPAAAALDAVRPVAQPPQEPLGLAAKLDASVRQLEAALATAHQSAERVAKAVSPFGELVVAPFKSLKPLVEAAR
jgi:rare lipoprotein A